MNMPTQVRAQVARVDEIQSQLFPSETPPNAAAAPEPSPAPSPAPAPASTAEWNGKVGDAGYWMGAFRSLQGNYSALKQESDRAIGSLTNQVTQLSQQIAALAASSAPAPAPTPRTALTPQDEEVFGSQLVDMVRRSNQDILPQVQQLVAQEVGKVQSENAQLKQQLQSVTAQTAQTAQEAFFSQLDKARPDWEQINVQPEWLQWLGQLDPLTGATRQVLLNDALQRQSLSRVLAMFEAFAGKPATAPAPAPAPARPDISPTPSTVGATVVPTSRDDRTPTVTRDFISGFYKDAANGKFRNNRAEYQRIEKQISDAVSAGKVV